jgi:hypothetical protein
MGLRYYLVRIIGDMKMSNSPENGRCLGKTIQLSRIAFSEAGKLEQNFIGLA